VPETQLEIGQSSSHLPEYHLLFGVEQVAKRIANIRLTRISA